MSNTKVTLYHADWCGHCKNFMPTWNALKKIFDQNNVKYDEYESDKNIEEIKNANVNGFPTIRISKNNKEYDYNGSRSPDDLLNEILPNLQKGGSKTKRIMINYSD